MTVRSVAATALLSWAVPLLAGAQTIDAPVLHTGDSWSYRDTIERGANGWSQSVDEFSVVRVTKSGIYFTRKTSGSTQPPSEMIAGLDWSRIRNVNGKETVVNQPFAFPLSVGKQWQVSYTEDNPNKRFRSERHETTASVIGYESIEVPAGIFNALKIEVEGHWTADLEPTQTVVQGAESTQSETRMVTDVKKATTGQATGRIYKVFWYAPEVKRWVKSIEETYASNGVRDERATSELQSLKLVTE